MERYSEASARQYASGQKIPRLRTAVSEARQTSRFLPQKAERSAAPATDNLPMGVFDCCGSVATSFGSSFRALSRAAAKSAAAKMRRIGILPVRIDWARRAEICERCPLRVVRKGISYCGDPFLQQIDRDPGTDGCGCPTREKAKSPSEHCPLTRQNRPANQIPATCNCKWCSAAG